MSEAILVEGLTKAYHGKTVVDHLNLFVKSGTVFGLLGANGAGKSTTIECILGTKQADAGTVRLLGQDPKKNRRALFQRIGVQFRRGIIRKKSGFPSFARKPQAFTARAPIGAHCVSSSESGTRQIRRSKGCRAANASGCLSFWR